MNKHFKRIISIFIILGLVTSLVACSNSSSPAKTTDEYQDATNTAPPSTQIPPETSTSIKSWNEATKIASDAYPGVLLKFEFSNEKGVLVYDIKILESTNRIVDLDVNAVTGEIIKIERENENENNALILRSATQTHANAIENALKEIPNSILHSSELESNSRKPAFEVEVVDENGILYEITIDGKSGEILNTLKVSNNTAEKPKISISEAASKAQQALGGGLVIENILEHDDGKLIYSITLLNNSNVAYDVEIDANNGNILKQEIGD